jgi:hypothetical protein
MAVIMQAVQTMPRKYDQPPGPGAPPPMLTPAVTQRHNMQDMH